MFLDSSFDTLQSNSWGPRASTHKAVTNFFFFFLLKINCGWYSNLKPFYCLGHKFWSNDWC